MVKGAVVRLRPLMARQSMRLISNRPIQIGLLTAKKSTFAHSRKTLKHNSRLDLVLILREFITLDLDLIPKSKSESRKPLVPAHESNTL
jgi:hypothetical protein